ncbi:hypothetical protein BSY18_3390 [Blastomonas sp. RAC04]|uniref:hypothetical protein n=1 Tax=Blastomonas sp. RAC04 TaxID=1842535 RepID=UPI00083CC866|nr:hypothetical protein [Blastomonas sp. RAC04]AOG00752.1 hypothetical protein BSY18_3390 [Blastomonas sp. RAC04]
MRDDTLANEVLFKCDRSRKRELRQFLDTKMKGDWLIKMKYEDSIGFREEPFLRKGRYEKWYDRERQLDIFGYYSEEVHQTAIAQFENGADAILFKLTWGGSAFLKD